MGRREDVAGLLRQVGLPLDDDDIADRLAMNRHYVNAVCRRLADEGLTTRFKNSGGKFVNQWNDASVVPETPTARSDLTPSRRAPMKRAERARSNIEALIGGFSTFVRRFEQSNAFPGPSIYFHKKAIERRRLHSTAADLMADERFFELVYAVLPAWGMHRMGKQAAKLGDFDTMVESFRSCGPAIEALWDLDISRVLEAEVDDVAAQLWSVLGALQVSTSATRIVAGSKALHHVLPDLVPPIDRQYTFQFFTGQKAVNSGEERAFLEWFPYLAEIGRRASAEIGEALERGGFMATSAAKIVDNAIIGFMQGSDEDEDVDAGED